MDMSTNAQNGHVVFEPVDDVDRFLRLLFKHRWDTEWLLKHANLGPYVNLDYDPDEVYDLLHWNAYTGNLDNVEVLDDADRLELSHLLQDAHSAVVLEVPVPDAAPLGPQD